MASGTSLRPRGRKYLELPLADAFVSLSADLPAGLWALLVVGAMLGTATILYLWWELFFKFVGVAWRRIMPGRAETLGNDGIPQHRR